MLIPTYPNRPSVVTLIPGATLFVSVRDAEHLRERRLWKRKLALAHPDSRPPLIKGTRKGYEIRRAPDGFFHPSTRMFRLLETAYRHWQESESAWYAAHGLKTPTVCQAGLPPAQQKHITAAIRCPVCHRQFIPRKRLPYLHWSKKTAFVCSEVCANRRPTHPVKIHGLPFFVVPSSQEPPCSRLLDGLSTTPSRRTTRRKSIADGRPAAVSPNA